MKTNKPKCSYCGRIIKFGHKNKEYCVKGVDSGRSCRQLAYLARKARTER